MVTDPAGWLGLAGGGDGGEGDDDLIILAPLGRDRVAALVVEYEISDACDGDEAVACLNNQTALVFRRVGEVRLAGSHALLVGMPVDHAHGLNAHDWMGIPAVMREHAEVASYFLDVNSADDHAGLASVLFPADLDGRAVPGHVNGCASCCWVCEEVAGVLRPEKKALLESSRSSFLCSCLALLSWGVLSGFGGVDGQTVMKALRPRRAVFPIYCLCDSHE